MDPAHHAPDAASVIEHRLGMVTRKRRIRRMADRPNDTANGLGLPGLNSVCANKQILGSAERRTVSWPKSSVLKPIAFEANYTESLVIPQLRHFWAMRPCQKATKETKMPEEPPAFQPVGFKSSLCSRDFFRSPTRGHLGMLSPSF